MSLPEEAPLAAVQRRASLVHSPLGEWLDGPGRGRQAAPLWPAGTSTRAPRHPVAAGLALEAGRPSAEHVLEVLGRLKDGLPMVPALGEPAPVRCEEPGAVVQRYDRQRCFNALGPDARLSSTNNGPCELVDGVDKFAW